MEKAVIINADDFGFSPGVTEGILQAHRRGVVTSTTLAANMPAAAEAVARLAETPDLGVGVHLNVSQGPALSPRGRERLAGADGWMNRTARQVIRDVIVRPGLLAAIEDEFEAQIRWALDHGVRVTHLDSHRHAHAFPPIFARVARLGRRYGIRFVRYPRERLAGSGWPAGEPSRRRTRRWLNLFSAIDRPLAAGLVATRGTWGVEHTGRIDAAWLIRAAAALGEGVTEIMTHPGLAGDLDPAATRLRESRQAELEALCRAEVAEAFDKAGVRRIHYGQL